MKKILVSGVLIAILSSCNAQNNNSERDRKIVAAISEKSKAQAIKTSKAAITNISILKLDSLTTSEYFDQINKNPKKLIEFQKQAVLSAEGSIRVDSLLMIAERDQPKEYDKALKNYKEGLAERTKAIEELNSMQYKVDSCDAIVKANPNDFFGYYVTVSFNYQENNEIKRGKAPFLVSKYMEVSRP